MDRIPSLCHFQLVCIVCRLKSSILIVLHPMILQQEGYLRSQTFRGKMLASKLLKQILESGIVQLQLYL